jgi:predicted SAM-dependent methyltransferase
LALLVEIKELIAMAKAFSYRARLISRTFFAFKQIVNTTTFEIRALLYSLVGMIRVLRNKKAYYNGKLEIGAGKAKRAGFITSNLNLKCNVPFDLRMGLPFPPNYLSFIYSEHVFEHFEYDQVLFLVSECYRTLKEGGMLSCCLPDASYYIRAYNENDLSLFNERMYLYGSGHSGRFRMNLLNYIFYMYGHHKCMFDAESFMILVKDAGFRDVGIREFDASLDQETRRFESFYVECVK